METNTRQMIIGISGKAGAGKDTVLEMIKEQVGDVHNRKFSGSLKELASELLGVEASMFESQEFKESFINGSYMTFRDFLIELGMLMRKVDHNYWVKKSMEIINDGINVFTDMRFPNEMNAIKDMGGVTVRINRNGNDGIDHESDTALDGGTFDYVIHNLGDLDDLRKNVKELVNKLGL